MEFVLFGKQITINKVLLTIIIIIAIIAAFIIGYFINQSGGKIVFEENEQKVDIKKETTESEIKQDNTVLATKATAITEIKVYVRGCVNNPGMVTIKKGDLIFDAVNAAGGVTEEADLDNINMAFKLNDNVMLRIKSKSERQNSASQTEASKTPTNPQPEISGVSIVKDSGGVIVEEKSDAKEENAKVNINTATANELDTLPGVGPSIAKDIISYREKSGGYKNIKDIMKVPGIKDKLFEKICDYIIVE